MTERPKTDAVDRRLRVLILAAALLLILEGALIFAAVPKPSMERTPLMDGTDSGDAGATKSSRQDLSPEALSRGSPEAAAQTALEWARNRTRTRAVTDQDIGDLLPPAAFFIARTISKSDIDDIEADAKGDGAFSRAYGPLADELSLASRAGAQMEAALAALYAFRTAEETEREPQEALTAPVDRQERWLAPEAELKKTHQNALDIFFLRTSGWGASEKGPVIRSMSPGIVVAAANNWVGGDGEKKYRFGGLTPRSGNGVVVYDPVSRRYFTYFHLHDVIVRPGQCVIPGSPLGHGGNTGANARARGHGGHLHLEIWDVDSGAPLNCYALRALILSL